MQPIDSNKQILTFPEVIGRSIAGSGIDKLEFQKRMMLTLKELEMPSAEAINVKNTVFLGHFTQDRKTAYLKIFNVDTFKNFLGNLEIYLRDALQHGTDMFVYQYESHSADAVFNHLRKKGVATVDTHKNKDGQMIAVVILDPNLVQNPDVKQPKKSAKKK